MTPVAEAKFTSDPETYAELNARRALHLVPADAPVVALKPERSETVDEASWESFPASDPPCWNCGSAAAGPE